MMSVPLTQDWYGQAKALGPQVSRHFILLHTYAFPARLPDNKLPTSGRFGPAAGREDLRVQTAPGAALASSLCCPTDDAARVAGVNRWPRASGQMHMQCDC